MCTLVRLLWYALPCLFASRRTSLTVTLTYWLRTGQYAHGLMLACRLNFARGWRSEQIIVSVVVAGYWWMWWWFFQCRWKSSIMGLFLLSRLMMLLSGVVVEIRIWGCSRAQSSRTFCELIELQASDGLFLWSHFVLFSSGHWIIAISSSVIWVKVLGLARCYR